MLNIKQIIYRLAIFVGISFAILLLITAGIAMGQYHQNAPNYECPKDCFSTFYRPLYIFWIWLGEHIVDVSTAFTALATIAISWFTFTLGSATTAQGELNKQTLQLARDEFNATHRPELIIREIESTYEGEHPVRDVIAMTIANRGSNPCTIVESVIEFTRWPDESKIPEWQAPRTNGKNEIGPLKFAAGEFHHYSWELPVGERVGHFERHYFRGAIIYTDAANIRRRYIFNRIAEKNSFRFLRTKNPDDEYTD